MLAFFFKHISGAIPNPYFQSFRGIGEFENATLLLVCRLDAPAATTVRRMITDGIAAEKNGLWGRAYVDGSHNAAPGYQIGDKWLADITEQFHRVGIPVVYDDSPPIFPDSYPMTDCALYYGWYAGQMAGPFSRSDFRFIQGAVAVHRRLQEPDLQPRPGYPEHAVASAHGGVVRRLCLPARGARVQRYRDRSRLHRRDGRGPGLVLRGAATGEEVLAEDPYRGGLPFHCRRDRALARLRALVVPGGGLRAWTPAHRPRTRRDADPFGERRAVQLPRSAAG